MMKQDKQYLKVVKAHKRKFVVASEFIINEYYYSVETMFTIEYISKETKVPARVINEIINLLDSKKMVVWCNKERFSISYGGILCLEAIVARAI